MIIPFNHPIISPKGFRYIETLKNSHRLSGEGRFNALCQEWLEENLKASKVILTPSCTSALEMFLLLMDIKPGDEVIVPSFTFTSTATAIVLLGGIPVFVDSDPTTLNIAPLEIEKAITEKTKGIIPVHYAGVGCDMEAILKIAEKHNLFVLEDAAQCMGASYKGKPLGTFGQLGAFSFHDTKNITCGEGGALVINDQSLVERAEVLRDKGSNRKAFFKGEVDKYTWVDVGSSYLMSEFQAAYLLAQLEHLEDITKNRLETWNYYHKSLKALEEKGFFRCPVVPEGASHNAHIYHLLLPSQELTTHLKNYLNEKGIQATTHYVPLHSSPAGKRFGRYSGDMSVVNKNANTLLRLPLYYGMKKEEVKRVIDQMRKYYE